MTDPDPSRVHLEDGTELGTNVKILDFAYVESGVRIGDNSIICSHSLVRRDVLIGSNTIIGPHCVIEIGARIGSNVTIQPFSVIAKGTDVGDDVFIGPHFSCANDKTVQIGSHGTSSKKQGYQEFPLKISRGAVIGSDVSLAPGVTVGEYSRIDMGCLVTRDVEPHDHVRASSAIVGRSVR